LAAPRSMQGLELVGKIKGLRMRVPSKLIRKLIKKKKRGSRKLAWSTHCF
jgi:hypothetical protein